MTLIILNIIQLELSVIILSILRLDMSVIILRIVRNGNQGNHFKYYQIKLECNNF